MTDYRGVTITTLGEQEKMAMWKSDRRLWLTADRSRAVPEDDPEARFLLVTEGGEISEEEAERLGLTGKKAEPVMAEPESESDTEGKALGGPPETKAMRQPPARKSTEA